MTVQTFELRARLEGMLARDDELRINYLSRVGDPLAEELALVEWLVSHCGHIHIGSVLVERGVSLEVYRGLVSKGHLEVHGFCGEQIVQGYGQTTRESLIAAVERVLDVRAAKKAS